MADALRWTAADLPDLTGRVVIVTGANLVIRHQRPTGRVGTQTGRIEKEAPLHISNVMLIGTEGKPTRAGIDVARDGSKERIDRKSGNALPKPK